MWLLIQALFALFAWSFAARAVWRSASLASVLTPALHKAVRAAPLSARLRVGAAVGESLQEPAIEHLFSEPTANVDELELAVGQAAVLARPPTVALRGMATIGTTLGLLAAIATLHRAIGGSPGVTAADAFDSALAGFVTALPLWTAVGLCGRRVRAIGVGLDRLCAAAVGEEPSDDAKGGSDREV